MRFRHLTETGTVQAALDQAQPEKYSSATGSLPEDVLFTENLLALSKAGLQARGDFPEPVLDESSSLVSVRRAR